MIKDKLNNVKITRIVVLFLRMAVGAVFAFSGFVKAIDPWGVLYKFQDYTAVLGWDWLSPFLSLGAFAISILEFVLGVCLIVGAYRRFSVWLAFFFMLVMTPLTLWLAITNAVPDCGCFGEAVVLSNTATFLKNVVLLVAIFYLLKFNVRLGNFYSPGIQWIVTLVTIMFISSVAFYGYFYQPMIDFRPYKTGETVAPVTDEENAGEDDTFVFVYEKDGELKEFSLENVPDEEDSTWHFIERRTIRPQKAEIHKANGLTLTMNGEEVTGEVMKHEGEQLILVFSDLDDINITYTYLINMLDDYARRIGVDLIGITGATPDKVDEWNDLSMATYPMYYAEDTELKILARGKPAVVFTRDGKVVWKRTLQSISATRVDEAMNGKGDFEWIVADYDGENRLKLMSIAYMSLMIIILIANRSYRVYKFSARLIKKNQK